LQARNTGKSVITNYSGPPQQKGFALRLTSGLASVLIIMVTTGCHTTTPPITGRLPPAPAARAVTQPTVKFFGGEPETVTSGQAAVLRWSVENADRVQIDNGVGEVNQDGKHAVTPSDTTTYKLEARKNSGGAAEAAVTIAVAKSLPGPHLGTSNRAKGEMIASELQDVHFDYDAGEIRPGDQTILEKDATVLNRLFLLDPDVVVRIEGHCDERGSAEYNLALGDRRASVVRETLVNMGLPAEKLLTVTFGKEHAICFDETEECYARNRRAHFSIGQ
jgi:peptidoglycan-associated lipoprotein